MFFICVHKVPDWWKCDRSPDAPSENEFELKVAIALVFHHSVISSIHALALVAKSRCKKLSLCKDTKTSGVAVCGSWTHRRVKTQQPCRPQLWGEAIQNVSLYDLGDCFLRKGDLQQLQKCHSKSPVISWKTYSNSTHEEFLDNRLSHHLLSPLIRLSASESARESIPLLIAKVLWRGLNTNCRRISVHLSGLELLAVEFKLLADLLRVRNYP